MINKLLNLEGMSNLNQLKINSDTQRELRLNLKDYSHHTTPPPPFKTSHDDNQMWDLIVKILNKEKSVVNKKANKYRL